MKIGIVGGTGNIGEGLALRLSDKHEIIIGSRTPDKACEFVEITAKLLAERGINCSCTGTTNQEAVDMGDIVIISVPYKHLLPTLSPLGGFENKIVITPVNPMEKNDFFWHNPPEEGSAAMLIKSVLPESARIVAAFNNISAQKWKELDDELDYSVAVCSDDEEAKIFVMDLVNQISRLKAFNAGPLQMASVVESITPLLLNIARYNKMKDVGIQFK